MNSRDQARMEDSWANARFAEYSDAYDAADAYREIAERCQGDIWGSAQLGEALVEAVSDADGEDLTALLTALRAGSYVEMGRTLERMVEARVERWAEIEAQEEWDRRAGDDQDYADYYRDMREGR